MRPLSDLLETSGQIGFRIGHAYWQDAAVYVSLSSRTSPDQGSVIRNQVSDAVCLFRLLIPDH